MSGVTFAVERDGGLSVVVKIVRENVSMNQKINWQQVFIQSRANGAVYLGDILPENKWQFPRDTWLSRRLKEVKEREEKIDGINK
jgi:hypothetical protein